MNYVYKHYSELGRKTIYGLPIYTNEVIHPNIHQEINIFVNSLCLYEATLCALHTTSSSNWKTS